MYTVIVVSAMAGVGCAAEVVAESDGIFIDGREYEPYVFPDISESTASGESLIEVRRSAGERPILASAELPLEVSEEPVDPVMTLSVAELAEALRPIVVNSKGVFRAKDAPIDVAENAKSTVGVPLVIDGGGPLAERSLKHIFGSDTRTPANTASYPWNTIAFTLDNVGKNCSAVFCWLSYRHRRGSLRCEEGRLQTHAEQPAGHGGAPSRRQTW